MDRYLQNQIEGFLIKKVSSVLSVNEKNKHRLCVRRIKGKDIC